jgi:hypothetical protein
MLQKEWSLPSVAYMFRTAIMQIAVVSVKTIDIMSRNNIVVVTIEFLNIVKMNIFVVASVTMHYEF